MGKRAKRSKGVTVADLKPGQEYGFLYCDVCGAECSADEADYSWQLPADHVFMCNHGEEREGATPMRLVRRVSRLAEVSS